MRKDKGTNKIFNPIKGAVTETSPFKKAKFIKIKAINARSLAAIKYIKPGSEGTAKGTKIQLAKNNKAVLREEHI